MPPQHATGQHAVLCCAVLSCVELRSAAAAAAFTACESYRVHSAVWCFLMPCRAKLESINGPLLDCINLYYSDVLLLATMVVTAIFDQGSRESSSGN